MSGIVVTIAVAVAVASGASVNSGDGVGAYSGKSSVDCVIKGVTKSAVDVLLLLPHPLSVNTKLRTKINWLI